MLKKTDGEEELGKNISNVYILVGAPSYKLRHFFVDKNFFLLMCFLTHHFANAMPRLSRAQYFLRNFFSA